MLYKGLKSLNFSEVYHRLSQHSQNIANRHWNIFLFRQFTDQSGSFYTFASKDDS